MVAVVAVVLGAVKLVRLVVQAVVVVMGLVPVVQVIHHLLPLPKVMPVVLVAPNQERTVQAAAVVLAMLEKRALQSKAVKAATDKFLQLTVLVITTLAVVVGAVKIVQSQQLLVV